jgi:hypothetical protein
MKYHHNDVVAENEETCTNIARADLIVMKCVHHESLKRFVEAPRLEVYQLGYIARKFMYCLYLFRRFTTYTHTHICIFSTGQLSVDIRVGHIDEKPRDKKILAWGRGPVIEKGLYRSTFSLQAHLYFVTES